jgi:hypothetical protein
MNIRPQMAQMNADSSLSLRMTPEGNLRGMSRARSNSVLQSEIQNLKSEIGFRYVQKN